MARRPVFITASKPPFFQQEMVDFTYYSGFAQSQKQKCVRSLHSSFLALHPQEKVLEISSMSEEELGIHLSAFYLEIETAEHGRCSVECAFQSSKVFASGGPYRDLLKKSSKEAKKDTRLRESGPLKSFNYEGNTFPLQPVTYFYNWLYIQALTMNPELAHGLKAYSAFTDIAFQPNKSINCQACAAALYVSLEKYGQLEAALESPEAFLKVAYGGRGEERPPEPLTIW